MRKSCYILLDVDGAVYTDYDLLYPSRLSKRRMSGNAQNVFKYTEAIIPKIFSDYTYNIVLLNPFHLCDRCTLAYEKLARLRNGSSEFDIFVFRGQSNKYKYNQPVTPLEDPEQSFEYFKEQALNGSKKQNKWTQAFLHSMYKIFNGEKNKASYMDSGDLEYNRSSSILDNGSRLMALAEDRFYVVDVKLIGNPSSSVLDIFEQSNNLISPIRCDNISTDNYDDELSAEYTFIAGKELSVEAIYNLVGLHGVVYSIGNADIRNLRIERSYTFRIPYYAETEVTHE